MKRTIMEKHTDAAKGRITAKRTVAVKRTITATLAVAEILALILVPAFLALFPLAPKANAAVSDWQKGISIQPSSGTTDFSSPAFQQSLQNAIAAHINYVTFIIPWYQSNIYSTDIQRGWDTPTDASLISGIQYAHSLGLHVMLKPHLNSYDGQWRAFINPSDRTTWFANYDSMILHYAQIAQANGVEEICIGTELISMAANSQNPTNTQNWQSLISQVRGAYSGKLTYSANWGAGAFYDEADDIAFWPQLDYIGISAYYDLNSSTNNVSDLESAWNSWNINEISPLYYKYSKPVLFSEIGYRSVTGAHTQPWNYNLSGGYDPTEQQNDYQALFDYWNNYSFMAGVSLWEWKIDPNAGGSGDTSYTPQNKPAQSTMAQWFGMSNSGGNTGSAGGGQAGAYTASATSPSGMASGQSASINVSVKNNSAQNASGLVIDNEIYNSSGQQVLQQYYQNQSIAAGQSGSYVFNWTPPAAGSYVLKVGVFSSGWSSVYMWNNDVLNLNVQQGATLSGSSGSGSSSNSSGSSNVQAWWPTNGATISGIQPFQGMYQGLSLDQYNMFWSVDNGQWNVMSDNYANYPHKQANVDVSGWTWDGNGPYDVKFIVQTSSGTYSTDVNIYVSH